MLSRLFQLLLIAVLAGCGAQTEAPRQTASRDAPSPAARLEPCQLLSRAEVGEVLGIRVADGQSSDTAEVLGSSSSDAVRQCSFYDEENPSDLRLVLSVMRATGSKAQFEQQLAMAQRLAGIEGTRVAGLGDAAAWFRESGSLKVLTGNVQFVIDDVASKDAAAEPRDALRKLALTVVKRRPVFEAVASDDEEAMEDNEAPQLTWWDSRQSPQAKQFSAWIADVEGLWIRGAKEHSQRKAEVLSKIDAARIQNWVGEIDALEGPREARTSMAVFIGSDGGLMVNLTVPEGAKTDPPLAEFAIGDIVQFSGKIQSIEGGAFGTREADPPSGEKTSSRDNLLQSLRPTTLNAKAAEVMRVTEP